MTKYEMRKLMGHCVCCGKGKASPGSEACAACAAARVEHIKARCESTGAAQSKPRKRKERKGRGQAAPATGKAQKPMSCVCGLDDLLLYERMFAWRARCRKCGRQTPAAASLARALWLWNKLVKSSAITQ